MEPKYCMHCGAQLSQGATFCTQCGGRITTEQPGADQGYSAPYTNDSQAYQQYSTQQNGQMYGRPEYGADVVTPDKGRLTPGVAALVSVLIVGLGQMINGQVAKGLIMLFGGMLIGGLVGAVVPALTFLVGLAMWILSGIDAYQCAKKLQRGESIGKFSFF